MNELIKAAILIRGSLFSRVYYTVRTVKLLFGEVKEVFIFLDFRKQQEKSEKPSSKTGCK
jgi:hypothetical protein